MKAFSMLGSYTEECFRATFANLCKAVNINPMDYNNRTERLVRGINSSTPPTDAEIAIIYTTEESGDIINVPYLGVAAFTTGTRNGLIEAGFMEV